MNKHFAVISAVLFVALAYGYYFNAAQLVSLPSVNEAIAHKKAELMEMLDDETKQVITKSMLDLKTKGMEEKFLKPGNMAPDFTLMNAAGKEINLYKILKKNNVVLTFYRGGWCPYCNIALTSLQLALPDITKNRGTLIAISPELPDKSLNTTERNKLLFHVLSDVGNKVARKYNLVFKMSPEMMNVLKSKGMDISEYNGDATGELPVPATYVIDQKGVIHYAFNDVDYSKRAEPNDIVNALNNIVNYKAVIER